MSRPAWPRVLVVTDRHRLVASTEARRRRLGARPRGTDRRRGRGGADLVQVRERDLSARTLLGFPGWLFARWPRTRQRVVVNDRADVAVAVAAGAVGVHLPARAMVAPDVRCLAGVGPEWVIGRSAHAQGDVTNPEGVSYWLVGTVQSSGSKPSGWTTLGWDGLGGVVKAAAPVPVVGIGGLTEADVPRIVASGATGMGASDASCRVAEGTWRRTCVERWTGCVGRLTPSRPIPTLRGPTADVTAVLAFPLANER